MCTELRSFAKQVASFTWQYRRTDPVQKLWEVVFDAPLALLEVKQALQQEQFKDSHIVLWLLRALLLEVHISQLVLSAQAINLAANAVLCGHSTCELDEHAALLHVLPYRIWISSVSCLFRRAACPHPCLCSCQVTV